MLFRGGKTNWTHILIWLILAVIVGGWILVYQKDTIREMVSLSQRPEIKKPETTEKIESSEDRARRIIKDRAAETILAIRNKDQEKLSNFAHPDKGIRFSPYSYVYPESEIVFWATQLLSFFENQTVYHWGAYDGSGLPIDLTPGEYYNRFIYDRDFANPEEISYNRIIGQGNTINNTFEVYPEAIIVEYHFSGTSEYAGMDWRSLRLAFEEKGNIWYLVGIIHDEWTI